MHYSFKSFNIIASIFASRCFWSPLKPLLLLCHWNHYCCYATEPITVAMPLKPLLLLCHWNHYCCYATETITVAMTLNHMLYKMILWYEGLPYDPLVHTVSRFISTNIVQVDLHTTIIYHNNTWTLTSTDKSKVYLHMSVGFI